MSAKHTPGPWQAEWPECEGNRYVSSTVTTVCTETAVCVLREDQEADARLIAAAPDLLEVVYAARKLVSEAAMTGFNYADGDWAERLFLNQANLSAAIAKATGSEAARAALQPTSGGEADA